VTIQRLLSEFPLKRISARDGMAVTAEVWQEAHEYHRLRAKFHALVSHGPGIVAGLEVIASDPPDSAVYILPGIAFDSQGQTIVLPEPTAYDFGDSAGTLHLLITYAESPPRADDDREDGPDYVHAAFSVEAPADLPDTAYVELARIRRTSRTAAITDPADATQPGADEIDMRFRRDIGIRTPEAAVMGVCYVGEGSNQNQGHGLPQLALAMRHAGKRVWVDEEIALDEGLADYALVYLVARGDFKLEHDEMTAVYDYLQQGGTLLFESCRANTDAEGADAAFLELLGSMGVELTELKAGDRLITEPYLFAAAPEGYETEGEPQVRTGGGVIYSTADYGCLWGAASRGRAASREEIRTATEWGENILFDALARRREARS
jgi:hypothetical protein